MVRFAAGERSAIGFHDIPEHRNGAPAQSRSELGTPLSSGCIRQWVGDAKALWAFASVGTTVVVAD
ncbi:MAG: L,D-transpeptidase [Nocardioidaceae bacterium]|nr:L,D-transpeptidase [Nocardioidaceae bacterium]